MIDYTDYNVSFYRKIANKVSFSYYMTKLFSIISEVKNAVSVNLWPSVLYHANSYETHRIGER